MTTAVTAFAAGLLSGWLVVGALLARLLLDEIDHITSHPAGLS